MATAQIIPAVVETEVVKKVIEPEHVNLKLTREEASSLARLAMSAVNWGSSAAFGQRIKAVYDALVCAGVDEERNLIVGETVATLSFGWPYPRDRTWGKRA